jgi:hypothetical protein
LSLDNIRKTYGDAEPTLAARNTALRTAYTGPTTLTTTVNGANSGSNSFAVAAADVINGLTGTARVANNNVGTHAYINVSGSAFNTNLSSQPSLVIEPAQLTAKLNDSAIFATQQGSEAPFTGVTFTGFVAGDSADTALIGSSSFNYVGPTGPLAVVHNHLLGEALEWADKPTSIHGNYDINYVPAKLTVIPAEELLITISSQTSTYGTYKRLQNDLPLADVVSARYCFDQTNCSSGLSSLVISPIGDSRWRVTDVTETSFEFDTSIKSATYSTGDFLNAGTYVYTINDDIQALAASLVTSEPIPINRQNFSGAFVLGGVLTVNPLTVNPSVSASDKPFDGSTAVRLNTRVSGLSGETIGLNYLSAAFDSARVGTNKTVTVLGLSLTGTDAANYRLAFPSLTTFATIYPNGPVPLPPVIKPIIPDLKPLPNPQPSNAVSRDDTSGSDNPFSLSVEPDDCRPDNLVACVCDPNPIDETMDICYVPKRSAQQPIAGKPNT